MSQKTIETINENDYLNEQIRKLKITNNLLTESERELAKRNHSNQKIIRMLVDKLKESDEILEHAFDELEGVQPKPTEDQPFLTQEMLNVIIF